MEIKVAENNVSAETGLSVNMATGLTVGVYLRLLNKSRRELADFLGLSTATVSRKTSGKVVWTVEDILGTATFLQIDAADLIPVRANNGTWVPKPINPAIFPRLFEPTKGLEPLTCCLQDSCSTN